MTTKRFLHLLVLSGLLINPVLASEERQQRSSRTESRTSASMYRFNFTLHIYEDGQDRPRHFSLMLEERTEGKLRALTRIPVKQDDKTIYVETGVKCDGRYQESEGKVRLEVELHYSDISATAGSSTATPTIHEWQSHLEATVPPNEVTVLSAYDGGRIRYQLDVKAEKLR